MNNTELLAAMIDLLRNNGVSIETPYDFENWIQDNAGHTQMFETGRFSYLSDDEE